MHSSISVIVTVTLAFIMLAAQPTEDGFYLKPCNEQCPRKPDAICQVRCLKIIKGQGQDCVNRFFDKYNVSVDCYF